MANRYSEYNDSFYERKGFLFSILAHLSLVAIIFFNGSGFQAIEENPIYSVTLEGGKTLGGRSQVAKDDKPQNVAPPKNVQEEKPQNIKTEEVKPEVKPEIKPEVKTELKPEIKKEEENTKKEIVIDKNEDVKPTPVPAIKTTPQPANTPVAPKIQATPPPKKETKEDVNNDYQKAMQKYLGNSTDARGTGFGAGKLGGNNFGGGEVRPREFFIYMDLLRSKIKEGWTWYDSATVLVTNVQFYLSPTGEISGAKIVRSSGNSAFDDSVVRAIRQANPLPPPPANVYQYFKYVNFIFDPRS